MRLFSFLFYQHVWTVIKGDLILVLIHFYNHSLRIAKLNHAMLCLISKEHNAFVVQKFRPISLVDCSYKIILKSLTNRLAQFMHHIVDPSQSAFIQGRYILDNVLVANEIIYFCQNSETKRFDIEVNF
jgi:Reverse transcriptase (RNA-dependent DNA polymerase)